MLRFVSLGARASAGKVILRRGFDTPSAGRGGFEKRRFTAEGESERARGFEGSQVCCGRKARYWFISALIFKCLGVIKMNWGETFRLAE